MPRIPQDTKSNSSLSLTGEGPKSGQGQDEDVIQFELARIARDQKDRLASFQLEDRLEGINEELSSEVDKIYGETLPSAGDGLTRKAVDAIDKRLDAESVEYNREEKERFRQAFEPFRPKLLQKAAELESEAREIYYLGRLRDQADRLSAKVLETGALAPDEFDGLKAKIEKADLTEHQKKDFSSQVQKEMNLAETKARLIKDQSFRESLLNGNDKLNLEKNTRGELVRFAKVHHLQTLSDEARTSYHDYKELDGMIARDEIGFTEAKPRISHLPQHLQDRLRAREQQRDDAFKLAQTFQANPKDKKSGEAILQHLTSGKDILGDDETRAFVAGFAARHQIIPVNIANTLRQAAETRDPARLIRAVELAEDIESVKQDVFKENRFSDLRGKAKLIQLLRERYDDEKAREEALLDILQPEKPLGMEELARLHGAWIEKQARLFASGEEARGEFTDQLRSGLEITNGERELALQIAEVMHSKEGKSKSLLPSRDQQVNRGEKEDRLDNTDYPEKVRENLEELKGRISKDRGEEIDNKIASIKAPSRQMIKANVKREADGIWQLSGDPKKIAKKIISLTPRDYFSNSKKPNWQANNKTLMRIIYAESTFHPFAHAKTTSASGIGQFTRDTWHNLIRENNKLLYEFVAREFIGERPKDKKSTDAYDNKLKALGKNIAFKNKLHLYANEPNLNLSMLKKFTEWNRNKLLRYDQDNPLPVNDTTLYLMHFMGYPAGFNVAKAMIESPNKMLKDVLPASSVSQIVAHNKHIKPTTRLQEIVAGFNKKFAEADIQLQKVGVVDKIYKSSSGNTQWLQALGIIQRK